MLSTMLVSGDTTSEVVSIINVPWDISGQIGPFIFLSLFLYLQDEEFEREVRIIKTQGC